MNSEEVYEADFLEAHVDIVARSLWNSAWFLIPYFQHAVAAAVPKYIYNLCSEFR